MCVCVNMAGVCVCVRVYKREWVERKREDVCLCVSEGV